MRYVRWSGLARSGGCNACYVIIQLPSQTVNCNRGHRDPLRPVRPLDLYFEVDSRVALACRLQFRALESNLIPNLQILRARCLNGHP